MDIQEPGRTTGEEIDALALLSACHRRIRLFTEVARRLSEETDLAPEAVAGAAADLHRYFSVALPAHAADEEEWVHPVLAELDLPAGARADLDGHLAAAEAEHARHRDLLDRLLPLWARLSEEPEALDALRDRLADAAVALETSFSDHLEREELHIHPLLRTHLDPGADEALVERMRNRRR
jgi:hemerythrin-like domain-containing protein